MLKMTLEEGGDYRLTIFCDWCEAPIEDATHGFYLWRVEMETTGRIGQPATGEIFFVHKGAPAKNPYGCLRVFEAAHGGRANWLSMELRTFPIFLVHDLGIDWAEARALAHGIQRLS
jgi:hypothetical protein